MALIYIVEDDKNISEIESFSLKNAGHETKEFADGKSFSRELMEKKPDLILLDVKPFGVMELVSRVKALLRRVGDQDSEKIMRIGDLVIDDEKRKVFVEDKPVELTYKEYELLHYLAQNQEIVLPRDSIMEHIWHANCEIESRTLDVHIKTLRHKLGDAGKYIKTVRNVGYCMNLV